MFRQSKSNPPIDPRLRNPDIQSKDYVIINNTDSLALAKQDITYTSPLIDNCSDYYLCISRFAISHMAIPIYFFDNADQKYSVTVRELANPANFNTQPLVYRSAGSYSSFGYTQPVFYYDQFINMINSAISLACAAVLVPAIDEPFIEYGEESGRFTFYFRDDFRNDYEIFFSAQLFQQIQFISSIFNGYGTPLAYKINLTEKLAGLNEYTDPTTMILYYYMTQEREALYLLNDIQNIAFVSNRIPTTRQYVPNLNDSGVLTSRAILVNFIPDLGQGRNLSEYQYYPQGFPNLINMETTQPLSTIDVQVFFVTKNETFYPLYLEPTESINIKFTFYKKAMFSNAYTSLYSDKSNTSL